MHDDENVLLGWYRTYIGPPDEESTVYGGFALFFGGIGLALIGIVLFLWSATIPEDSMFMYTLREIAGIAGAIGLPALLVGVTVLLPVDRRAMYAAGAGTVVCLVGVALFSAAYPFQWNVAGTDRSGQVVAVYALGIVAVIAATGAGLVGHRVQEAATTEVKTVPAEEADTDDEETGPDVTDEQVRRDIDEAMANTELSWGGVERKTKTKRLKLNTDDIDGVDSTNVADVEAKTTRSSGQNVDDAVSGLSAMRGGKKKESRSTSTTDDQTAALQELRKQQQAEEVASADSNDGVVGKVKNTNQGVIDKVKNIFSS